MKKNRTDCSFLSKRRLKIFLTTGFLLTFALQINATAHAQDARVSLNLENASFREAARALKAGTGFTFLYRDEQVKTLPPFTLRCENMKLEEVLGICLKGSDLTFQVVDRTIIIMPRNEKNAPATQARQVKITGTVVDTRGNPVAGASVRLKGSTTGAATRADGTFEINIPEMEKPVLLVTFIGMKNKEVTVDGDTPLVITLEEEITEISDVIVTGIFTRAKESYTGAVTTISARDLKAAGNRSVLSSIRNIDPSFNIIEDNVAGSDPNTLPDITIRGRASMDMNVRDLQEESSTANTANLPLFILDGFEVSLQRVMDMDQELVESITLLKDASATAMYGSRGANGIVVIQSRRPAEGRLRVNYRGNLNIEAPDFTSYNLMNAREKLEYEKEANLYYSIYNMTNQRLQEIYDLRKIEVERGVDTYWLKYPIRVGIGNRHSLSVDGGAREFLYSGSVAYNHIAGVMKKSARETITASLFFQYAIDRVKFQNNLTVTYNKHGNSPYGTFSEYATANPIYTPYDDEGHVKKMLNEITEGSSPGTPGNPLYNATLPTRDDGSYLELQDNLAIEWNIAPGLSFRGRFSITKQDSRGDNYLSRDHTSFENSYYTGENYKLRGSYIYSTGYLFSYEGDATLNYNKTFAGKHALYAGASYNIGEDEQETYSVVGQGFSASNKGNLGMASAYATGKPNSTEQHSRRVGAILNLNYTYNRRYFVDFSGKIEGSSKFGSNERVAPFWSAGLGWNIHHEAFLKEVRSIDNLRVRLSHGTTGSQNFNSYQALTTYRYFGQETYKFWNGAYMIGLGNPDLTWQKTVQTNFGLEAALFNSRVHVNVDLYNKLTESLLTDVNLPTSGGFQSFTANVGEVRNRGIEATVNAFVLRNATFAWSVGGTLMHNANKILKISNSLEFLNSELMAYSGSNPSFLYEEGQSMNTIYVVRSLGIDPATGQELFLDKEGNRTYTWNAADKVPCGINEPKAWGNLRSMFRWKGLTLNLIFSYRTGGYSYNQTLVDKVENIGSPWRNLDRRALHDRWKSAGDRARFKNIRDFNSTYASSRFVMKENTIRLNSVNVSYDFDVNWLEKHLDFNYLTVGVYAEDVFHLSSIKQERGTSYPFSRKYAFSVAARF
ncbi:MAG: SusC/RagA family TonB-linked outer membrane protein [Odoribacteraceae bacterium]|jgi:TonB-linked SusC/RagA family outer membrane protein|nr:SusC/RagA family TonB-linked outer membrane protein [Odoribacteraceae bacterium]